MVKITSYQIGADPSDADARLAAFVLRDELERRTGLAFAVAERGQIEIAIDKNVAPAPEGYVYKAFGDRISIVGFDRLGALYGAGRLLKECRWGRNRLETSEAEISAYPKKSMRGSQVGYRNKTNAYIAWDKQTYRQYITDLALFGANSIEFLPGRTDDADSSPVMKYNSFDMLSYTVDFSHSLGLKVWLWYPNLIKNETGIDIPSSGFVEETSDAAVQLNKMLKKEDEQREHDFSNLSHIDNILIPGGDPGELEPQDLFAFSERVANILHKYHPNAGVWISAQVMKSSEEFKLRFYKEVARRPSWLTGICHAPWVSHTMKECREHTPLDLPIRSYPDICHSLCCQYPIHGMDPVWAVTAGREFYNPRPRWHKRAHNLTAKYNVGNIAYSEGIADDVEKFIWIDQDWSEDIPTSKTLRDFANMFISPDHAEELASAIAGFEDVFDGPAVSNAAVPQCYAAMKNLEEELGKEAYMPGFGTDSYRFKMPRLMSAFYLYIQRKAIRDKAVYSRAVGEIDAGGSVDEIVSRIRADLTEVDVSPAPSLLEEIWTLADELYQRINWKLSTTRHFSPDYSRGGFLDTLTVPLCNAYWLEAQLAKLPSLPDDAARLARLRALRDRRCAGPGGKYISLGEPWAQRYLRLDKSWWDEPEAITIPRIEQYVGMWDPHLKEERPDAPFDKILLERVSSALGYYKANVVLDIDGLVPGAPYELRIVFPLRFGWKGQSDIPAYITACGQRLKHIGNLEGDEWVYIYDVPAGLVDSEGKLTLVIDKEEGPRGSGATELWLIKK